MVYSNNGIYNELSNIFVTACGILADQITNDTNVISDLGIDSIDFLDVTYDIDNKFGIKLPIEEWMASVNEGETSLDSYFVMRNFVQHISKLIARSA